MITFTFYPKKFLIITFLIVALFFALDFALYFDLLQKGEYLSDYYDEYLNITYETNLPTLFSALLSLFSAIVAYLLYSKQKRAGWLIATLFFGWMGMDDALQLHEYIGSYLGDLFLETGFVSYYWQVFFDPLFILTGLYLFYFLLQSFHNQKCLVCTLLVIAGFGFYAVAVLLDYYEGTEPNLDIWMDRYHLHYYDLVHLMRAVEEMIEMLGAAMIAGALLFLHPLRITIG